MKSEIFILTVVCFLNFACKEEVIQPDTTIVKGIVCDSTNNLPLDHVQISLHKSELFSYYAYEINSFFSDESGNFFIKFVHDEGFVSYSLQLNKANYYYPAVHIEKGVEQYFTIKMINNNYR